MRIPNVLEVIYAPQKAFKKISEKPTLIAPVLAIILFVAANVGYVYASASKVYLEQTFPLGMPEQEWTQNTTLWTSNAIISQSTDFVNGTGYLSSQYYGNGSLAFSAANDTQLSMQLAGIGAVNCSNPGGYYRLSFRTKQTTPATGPASVIIRLYSANSSDNFYKSLADDYAQSSSNQWQNETILLDSEGWSASSPNANWSAITGLKLEFTWLQNSNLSLLINGVFFHGPFQSWMDIYGTSYLLNVALSGVMQFTITWVILSGLVYLMTKGFGGQIVWRIVLMSIGLVLITMFVFAIINIIGTSFVSTIQYPFELTAGFKGEALTDAAYNKVIEQTTIPDTIGRYGWIVIQIWAAILCSVAVRVLAAFSWMKSFLVGATTYAISLMIGLFLFGI